MFCPKCGNEVKDGVQFCPKCGGKMREDQKIVKNIKKQKTLPAIRMPQIPVKAAAGILGAVLVIALIIVLSGPRVGKIDTQMLMTQYFEEHTEFEENKSQYRSCFRYVVNDLTDQLSADAGNMLGRMGADTLSANVQEVSSQLGQLLSGYFSNDENQKQLAETVMKGSYFEAGKAKKKDGVVYAEVSVRYLDISDINSQVIEESVNLSELVSLIKNGNIWINALGAVTGDASFILDRFEEIAADSLSDNICTGTVEFTYNKKEKQWEISHVDGKLLDAYFGIQ